MIMSDVYMFDMARKYIALEKRFGYISCKLKSLLESETPTTPNTNNLIVLYLPEPVNRLDCCLDYGIQ